MATVARPWDDPAWEAAHRARACADARRWDRDIVAGQYLAFFDALARRD